jgi:hypothetical protein
MFLLLIISVGHFWGRLASLLVAMVGGRKTDEYSVNRSLKLRYDMA